MSQPSMLSHLATRGIVTRNICGVWVEDERAFRRHTVHPNLCHFLESIPNRPSLKEIISFVYVSYLYSISMSFHQPAPFCMTVWPIPTGIIVLWCWYLASTPCWRSAPACSGRLDLQRLLAKLYLSQELGCCKASSALSLLSFLQLARSENAA